MLTPRLSQTLKVVSCTLSSSACTSSMKPHFVWSGMLDAVIIENGDSVLDVLIQIEALTSMPGLLGRDTDTALSVTDCYFDSTGHPSPLTVGPQ